MIPKQRYLRILEIVLAFEVLGLIYSLYSHYKIAHLIETYHLKDTASWNSVNIMVSEVLLILFLRVSFGLNKPL